MSAPSKNLPAKRVKTVEVKPRHPDELIMPRELVDILDHGQMTHVDSRIWDALIANAHGPDMLTPGHRFKMDLAALRDAAGRHERIADAVTRLKSIVLTIADHRDNKLWKINLLNDVYFDSADLFEARSMTYAFSPLLAETIYKHSEIYARIDERIGRQLTSKYSRALYKMVTLRAGLHKPFEEMGLDYFRNLLGVPDDKLDRYVDLNRFAIQPAVAEVNAITEFNVRVEPMKAGRKVASITLVWSKKAAPAAADAAAVRQLPRPVRREVREEVRKTTVAIQKSVAAEKRKAKKKPEPNDRQRTLL